jgi:hypothetical protein
MPALVGGTLVKSVKMNSFSIASLEACFCQPDLRSGWMWVVRSCCVRVVIVDDCMNDLGMSLADEIRSIFGLDPMSFLIARSCIAMKAIAKRTPTRHA